MQLTERQKWGAVWITWGTIFAVAETKALKTDHPHAPLSAHLRWVLGVHRKSKLGKAVFGAFFAWLFFHLW